MRRAFARDLVPSRLIESIDTAKSATLFLGLTPAVHDPASVSLLRDPLVAVDAVRERMKVEPAPSSTRTMLRAVATISPSRSEPSNRSNFPSLLVTGSSTLIFS